ncbi:MAG: phosphopantothenoylcysteine decarboxylase [Elusimicrobiota bacterium]|nr:phosphopantothenoylcysteine decarboxylase [Elusimicrobiota bacterium]
MKQKIVLITAGPTKEYIDPVRFISNDSSGKMGYLLAEESKKKGAKVILISGPTNLNPPKNVKVINVVSAEQMFGYVKKYFGKCDVFISCAAVGDYRIKKFSKNKIKKTGNSINLKLIPNPDILFEISKTKGSRILVGFALESESLIKNAKRKLKEKKLDIIIANKVDSMNSDKMTGAIISKNKIEKFKNIPKKLLAEKITKKYDDLF